MHSTSPPPAHEPGTATAPEGVAEGPQSQGLAGLDPPTQPSPASSLLRGRTKSLLWPRVAAGAVFAIAGALFIASATASEDGALRVDRTGGLPQTISARADQNGALATSVDQLSMRVDGLTVDGSPGTMLARTNDQIAALAPVVGLTDVVGPGLSVSLDDATPPQNMPRGFTGDDYIVHQEDVQGVVNALWRGGASGVTVMGQRLISTSAVRCVGNTVILQGQVYSPPFIIEAVGDVAKLGAALEAEESVQFFKDWAEVVGLGYSETARRELTLPAYTGPNSTIDSQVLPDLPAGDDA